MHPRLTLAGVTPHFLCTFPYKYIRVHHEFIPARVSVFLMLIFLIKEQSTALKNTLTGSAVITHDVTTGTGYCLVGFNWIIDVLN